METVALILLCAFMLAGVVGSIWLLVTAVRVSPLWFLAVLLIPGAVLVFAYRHWDVARKPFALSAVPMLVGIGAAILIPNLVTQREDAEAGAAGAIEEVVTAVQGNAPDLGKSGDFADRFLRGDATAGCPPEATLQGARPPEGFALWCEQEGVKHGPHATWHPNGRPASAGLYRDGRREGVWLRYHPKGGLVTSATFRGDVQHGPMREYDALGADRRETRWVDGAPAG